MNGIAIFFLASGILLSAFVFIDTKKHPQPMSIMRIVWTLTMLWASWIGLAAYIAFGRHKANAQPMAMDTAMSMDKSMTMDDKKSMPMDKDGMMMMDNMDAKKPKWQGIALSTLHCGAGCVLADLIGETLAGIVGLSLFVGWGLDYILALAFGVYFQYMAIKQMGNASLKMAINKAIKADLLSLTAWQIGMYGFMGLYLTYFANGTLSKASFDFWFIMQIAMIAGFITSYPMNILLIKIGLKKAM